MYKVRPPDPYPLVARRELPRKYMLGATVSTLPSLLIRSFKDVLHLSLTLASWDLIA